MANLIEHGGHCCGVRHIAGMDGTTVAELERRIARLEDEESVGGPNSGRLIEIILSSRQVGDMQYGGPNGWAPCVAHEGGWPVVLRRLGFRLVSRFNNANSGKDCYIFHRVPHFSSIRPGDLPFAWEHTRGAANLAAGAVAPVQAPPPPVPVPVPANPQPVLTTFHNVLRTGRGAGFDTRAAAAAAAPRARSIDRRVVMSDGTIRWTEGV